MSNSYGYSKQALTALIFIASISALYLLLQADLNPVLKFGAGIAMLFCTSLILQHIWNIDGQGGLLLIKSKKGLHYLDTIANLAPNFWKAFADAGLVFGFGLSSIFVFSDFRSRLKYYAPLIFGSILLMFFYFLFIVPAIVPLASSLITGVDLSAAGKAKAAGNFAPDLLLPISIGILLLGGVAIFSLLGLLYYSFVILSAFASFILGNPIPIQTTEPGASFLLPGINLPLFEGVIALFVLLLVHEASHGILARIAKIRLDSAGIVLFGILPVGAFIDPDEKELAEAEPMAQKRVLVAGSSANFATSLIAFAVLFLFVLATPSFRDSGIYIVTGAGELPTGAIVTAIDGNPITDSFKFPEIAPGQISTFTTDQGEKTITANSEGKFGITYNPITSSGLGWKMLWKPEFLYLEFAFSTFALIFLLNFIVGVVNLLPLPFFDGQRIFELTVQNKAFVRAVTLAVAAAFVLNFLPWMFR